MQVVVNQLLTSYTITGKGKTILLIPGWADTSASFSKLAGALSHDFEVIALDLPGFGGSQAPATAWDLNEYAIFIAAFLKKLQKQAWVIVGHSNGGAITLYGAAHNIFTPRKLILLASAGIRDPQSAKLQLLRIATKVGKIATYPLPSGVRKRLRSKLYTSVGSDMLVAEHMKETFKRIINQDVINEATSIHIPTLLIYGSKDTATPPTYGEQFARAIEKSSLTVIPDAGHFVHHDKPEEVNRAIEAFLR